jgi:hypothetical protein
VELANQLQNAGLRSLQLALDSATEEPA